MKTVCLLLCLGVILPHDIAGNIIRGQKMLPNDYKEVIRDSTGSNHYKQTPTYQEKNHKRSQQQYVDENNKNKMYLDEYLTNQNYNQPKTDEWLEGVLSRNFKKDRSSSESASHETKEKTSTNTQYDNGKMYKTIYTNVRDTGFNLEVRGEDNTPIFQKSVEWGKRAGNQKWNSMDKNIENYYNEATKTISHVSESVKQQFAQMYQNAVQMPDEDSRLNGTELMNKYNYNVEEHVIKTDDGYFLTIFRMRPQKPTGDVQRRPVVFLMHGLLGSSDDWLLMGPGKSLAYLLSDAGYDVWMGNARGSKYSRQHASKHEAQPDFWQFSIDEIALNDLPAMINYVLKTAEQQKMFYVGHSTGNTAFFALASARPEYNNKIITMYALSPMVYMSNAKSPLFRMIAPSSPYYQRLHDQLGHSKFKPSKEVIRAIGGNIVESETGVKALGSQINFAISGVNVDNLDAKSVPIITSHLPAGASVRQIKQYGQAVDADQFRKYDYGSYINEKVYGSEQPPEYKMKQVNTPVVLYYSENDWLSHPKDVQRLQSELSNVTEAYKVPHEYFSQMDFQFSPRATDAVHKRLLDSIQHTKADY